MIQLKHKITEVIATTILDSRNRPTIETTISSKDFKATASVPSGASTGIYESLELRDKDGTVNTAVNNVNTAIKNAILNEEVNQEKIDKLMLDLDGTENKSKLGANSILSASLALAKLKAKVEEKPLYESIGHCTTIPFPFMNIINGGRHAKNKLAFQEFMGYLGCTPSMVQTEKFKKIRTHSPRIPSLNEACS